MRESVPEWTIERKPPPLPRRQPPPDRRRIGRRRVTAHDQALHLMRRERGDGRRARRPPAKAPAGEPLVREPKPLAVIAEQPQRGLPPIPEDKDAAREGIRREDLAAHAGQSIDPPVSYTHLTLPTIYS